jgi:hypothetical protein
VLFKLNGLFYLKIDHDAIELQNISCFSDTTDCLLKAHYVFNLEYKYELRLVYGFLEKLMNISCTMGPSTVLGDLMRAIK